MGRASNYIIPVEYKTCTKCHEEKHVNEYYSYWRGWVRKYMSECKECIKKRNNPNPKRIQYDNQTNNG